MTSTYTTTRSQTYTRTHTATYLADAVLGAISDILAHLGIPTSRGSWDLERDEKAIAAWFEEGSLKEVVLECHRPDGEVRPVFEFPVHYTDDTIADVVEFKTDTVSLAKYRAKLASVPTGTRFSILCTFNGPHSSQAGWGPGTRASTAGLRSLNFGTLATGPDGTASLRYLH